MNLERRQAHSRSYSRCSLFLLVLAAALPLSSLAQTSSLLRVITPVRLSLTNTAADVALTRPILERFQAGGYQRAVWAVAELPEKTAAITNWAATCLQAFPTPPILALDCSRGTIDTNFLMMAMDEGVIAWAKAHDEKALDRDRLKTFLGSVLPHVDSVLVNYTRLNNGVSGPDAKKAIALAKRNAELVKGLSKDKFVWLFLYDDPCVADRAGVWTKELDKTVDGYWLYRYRWLYWDAAKNGDYGDKPTLMANSGKPLVRGNFLYTATSLRPGLEKDMAENYRQRMPQFDKWLSEKGYAGFAREIGSEVPRGVVSTENYTGPALGSDK